MEQTVTTFQCYACLLLFRSLPLLAHTIWWEVSPAPLRVGEAPRNCQFYNVHSVLLLSVDVFIGTLTDISVIILIWKDNKIWNPLNTEMKSEMCATVESRLMSNDQIPHPFKYFWSTSVQRSIGGCEVWDSWMVGGFQFVPLHLTDQCLIILLIVHFQYGLFNNFITLLLLFMCIHVILLIYKSFKASMSHCPMFLHVFGLTK